MHEYNHISLTLALKFQIQFDNWFYTLQVSHHFFQPWYLSLIWMVDFVYYPPDL